MNYICFAPKRCTHWIMERVCLFFAHITNKPLTFLFSPFSAIALARKTIDYNERTKLQLKRLRLFVHLTVGFYFALERERRAKSWTVFRISRSDAGDGKKWIYSTNINDKEAEEVGMFTMCWCWLISCFFSIFLFSHLSLYYLCCLRFGACHCTFARVSCSNRDRERGEKRFQQ